MKLKIISTVTIISTGTHFLGNHYQIALKMGRNHKITDDMIVEMHLLQTNWQDKVFLLYFLKKMREKYHL